MANHSPFQSVTRHPNSQSGATTLVTRAEPDAFGYTTVEKASRGYRRGMIPPQVVVERRRPELEGSLHAQLVRGAAAGEEVVGRIHAGAVRSEAAVRRRVDRDAAIGWRRPCACAAHHRRARRTTRRSRWPTRSRRTRGSFLRRTRPMYVSGSGSRSRTGRESPPGQSDSMNRRPDVVIVRAPGSIAAPPGAAAMSATAAATTVATAPRTTRIGTTRATRGTVDRLFSLVACSCGAERPPKCAFRRLSCAAIGWGPGPRANNCSTRCSDVDAAPNLCGSRVERPRLASYDQCSPGGTGACCGRSASGAYRESRTGGWRGIQCGKLFGLAVLVAALCDHDRGDAGSAFECEGYDRAATGHRSGTS